MIYTSFELNAHSLSMRFLIHICVDRPKVPTAHPNALNSMVMKKTTTRVGDFCVATSSISTWESVQIGIPNWRSHT